MFITKNLSDLIHKRHKNLKEEERYIKLKNISSYFNDKYIEVRREVTKLIQFEKRNILIN